MKSIFLAILFLFIFPCIAICEEQENSHSIVKDDFVYAGIISSTLPANVTSMTGNPVRNDDFLSFDGQSDTLTLNISDIHFEDDTPFSIAIIARMHDDNRFLCSRRWHFQRSRFMTRGEETVVLSTGINDDKLHTIILTYTPQIEDQQSVFHLYVDGILTDSATLTGSALSSYPLRDVTVGYSEHGGRDLSRVDIILIQLFSYTLGTNSIDILSSITLNSDNIQTTLPNNVDIGKIDTNEEDSIKIHVKNIVFFTFMAIFLFILCIFLFFIIKRRDGFKEYVSKYSNRFLYSTIINRKYVLFILVIALSAYLTITLNTHITESRMTGDAASNTRMAYNFLAHNTLSLDRHDNPRPTSYREPLTPLFAGLFLKFSPGIDKTLLLDDLMEGKFARKIKQVNLIWAFIGLLGCFALVYILLNSYVAGITAILLSYHLFFNFDFYPVYMDRLLTELPTASLMLWATFFLIYAIKSRNILNYIFVGIFMGLLALTKAIFLYISTGVLLLLLLYLFIAEKRYTFLNKIFIIIIVIFSFIIIVGPWMIRNKVHFDTYAITQRGGAVLLMRAEKNFMNKIEFYGMFHRYGPRIYQAIVKDTFLDVNPLDYEIGGPLQRIKRVHTKERLAERQGKPEIAYSFYTKARAWRTKMKNEFQSDGHPNPSHAADTYLQRMALQMITDNPARHLVMTLPFGWRGFWCFSHRPNIPFFEGRNQVYANEIINLISFLSIFIVLMYGFCAKNFQFVAFSVIALGMFAFNSLFTHNLPRYNTPIIPIAVSSLVLIFFMIYYKIKQFIYNLILRFI